MNTADIDPLLHPLKDLLPVQIDGDRREGQSFRLSEFPSTMPEMFEDALRSGVEVAYHKIPVSSLYFESLSVGKVNPSVRSVGSIAYQNPYG